MPFGEQFGTMGEGTNPGQDIETHEDKMEGCMTKLRAEYGDELDEARATEASATAIAQGDRSTLNLKQQYERLG